MKTLISSYEVLAIAFPSGTQLTPASIGEADIVAATERWIRPLVGEGLFQRLLDGEYRDLCHDYVAPALAFATRLLVQPRLDLWCDRIGTTAPRTALGSAADTKELQRLERQLRREMESLLGRLNRHLHRRAADYPEYDPHAVRHLSSAGGILLKKPHHGTRSRQL